MDGNKRARYGAVDAMPAALQSGQKTNATARRMMLLTVAKRAIEKAKKRAFGQAFFLLFGPDIAVRLMLALNSDC